MYILRWIMRIWENSRIQLAIIFLIPLVLIVSSVPISSAQLSESERLAGTTSDAGNVMLLERLDSEVVLPNEGFSYFLKRVSENFRVAFEFNQEKKAQLLLDIAEERKREVRILEERGIQIDEEVVRDQRNKVEEADRIIQRLETQPAPDPATRQSIINKIQEQFDEAEISEIRAEFQKVRIEQDRAEKERLASQLDDRLNKRTDVRVACFGGINTLSIADSPRPVEKIRENCPVLKVFPEEEIRRVMEVRDGS